MARGRKANASQREPLANTTNSSIPLPEQPVPRSVFLPNLDSSESVPSTLGSIVNASICDESDDAPAFVTGGLRVADEPGPSHRHISTDTLVPSGSQSLHLPTPLETIAEQSSTGNLRERSGSLNARDKPRHSTNGATAVRRRRAFSLNDTWRIKQRWKAMWLACGGSSSASSSDHLTNMSPYPLEPLTEPPTRYPTPPGLPTFNTAAAATYRLPPPRIRLRDMLPGRPAPLDMQEWSRQTSNLPRGAIMRGSNGVVVRGRFAPLASAHTGFLRPTVHSRGAQADSAYQTRQHPSTANVWPTVASVRPRDPSQRPPTPIPGATPTHTPRYTSLQPMHIDDRAVQRTIATSPQRHFRCFVMALLCFCCDHCCDNIDDGPPPARTLPTHIR